MLRAMPDANDYRPMHGRAKGHDLEDGTHTRVKIDLFPEYIRHLPPEKRAIWDLVGRALCSQRGQAGLRPHACARAQAPLRRRLRQGRHVSDPDPDPRHPGLPDHAAHRHEVEGHHRPALSAARQLDEPHRHDLPRPAARRQHAQAHPDEVLAEHRLRLRGGRQHLAFGRPDRTGGQDPRFDPADLLRRLRDRCASRATAASARSISCSTSTARSCG